MQNDKNWNGTHPRNTKQMLSEEDKINLKKIMTEKKITLPSLEIKAEKKLWSKLKSYFNYYQWTTSLN